MFRRREENRALTRESLPSVMVQGTSAGPLITTRNALAVPAAWSCVRALVDATSSLPLHVYRHTEAGRVRAEDTPTAILLDHPAPGVTQPAFLGQLMTTLQLHGEAFVGKWRDEAGRVSQLGFFDPSLVEVEVIGGSPLYTITATTSDQLDPPRVMTLTPADVIHVRGPLTLDGVRGASPVKVAREAFGYAASLQQHGTNTMSNGCRISGVLNVEEGGPAAEEMLTNLVRDFEARHRGGENSGKIAALLGAVKFQQVSMSMEDAQWLGSCEYSASQVASIFRCPPWIIGAKSGDSLTYSTVAEQMRAFVTFSLRPWLVSIEAALAADAELFAPGSQTYCLHELDALLRADPAARWQTYATAVGIGAMTVDEIRELEDLPVLNRQEATADA